MTRRFKESHQGVDLVSMFAPVTKWSELVATPDAVPEMVRKAFKLAQTERPDACTSPFPRTWRAPRWAYGRFEDVDGTPVPDPRAEHLPHVKRSLDDGLDGAFLMNSQEIETARREGIALVVLVWVGDAYGLIKWKMELKLGPAVDTVRQSRLRRLRRELRRPWCQRSRRPRSCCLRCAMPWVGTLFP